MLKKLMIGFLCSTLLIGCTFQKTTIKNVIYVNVAATNTGDGSSWDKAFNSLAKALESSNANCEIWVAKGTYYPSKTDAAISFIMKDNVSVYGGFSGVETSKDARDWENNETILSGEIGDSTIKTDNSNHVVIAANNILDGFTIQDGYGKMGGPPPTGAGTSMPPSNDGSGTPPSNSGNTNSSNASSVGHSTPSQVMSGDASSSTSGAGLIIWGTAPKIANCTITDNFGGKAGGVYIINTSKLETLPTFTNCTISDNFAQMRGGGVSIDMNSNAIFIDTIFSNNECAGKGGAIYDDFGCSPLFENCLFVNNKAESGAAVGNDGNSSPKFSNCTFYGNDASEAGAALYQGTGPFNDPVVKNSIIWGNSCQEDLRSVYNWNDCNPKISYSLIQDGYAGENILDMDPLFNDAKNMDFSLKETSPCLKVSSEGGKIGFDASIISTRKDTDYSILAKNLESIKSNDEPTSMVLTNPISSKDASEVGNIIYVKPSSDGNGSSWNTALGSIQKAIDYANAKYTKDKTPVEIWVSKGTYYTGTKRSDSFILRSGINLYGGFSGVETTLNQRNSDKNVTVLSGDIGVLNDISDNSYHVLIGSDDAILDGFTITGGNADKNDGGAVYDNKGGGMLNYHAGNRVKPSTTPVLGFNTTVKDCVFENNYAIEGGASYTYHGSSPTFENCQFNNNTAYYGGAVIDRAGINSKYINCDFTKNTAKYKGGACFVDYGSMATFTSCNFNSNTSGTAGGSIYVIDRASQATPNSTDIASIDSTWTLPKDIFSSVLIEDSSFVGNIAGTNGGAIYAYDKSNVKVVNSKFDSNTAKEKGGSIGIYYGSKLYLDTNSTFTNNTPENIYKDENSK